MAKTIKRIEMVYTCDDKSGNTLQTPVCDFNRMELIGLFTIQREQLLREIFSLPPTESEVTTDEQSADTEHP